MRGLAASIIVVGALGLLSGCTPAREPIIALAVRDGKPFAVLLTCDNSLSQVAVYQDDDGRRSPVADRRPTRWTVMGRPETEIIEVELLGNPPAGWEPPMTGMAATSSAGSPLASRDGETLAQLQPDVRYRLAGSNHRTAVPVRFTVADFSRVGASEVLAPTQRGTVRVMPRDEFLRNARDSCGLL